MAAPDVLVCPLCDHASVEIYSSDKQRDYYQCHHCRLVFVPPWQRLSREEEKAHYDLHENSPYDHYYRQFLSRLAEPLTSVLKPGMSGLDFGSGPGPTLSVMLEEAGFHMSIYDIFYADEPSVLQLVYDFITATEVVEHLSRPGDVLDHLWSRVKLGGWLGMMTKMVLNPSAFGRWHYKNDQTHICFYSREVFNYLGARWNASVQFFDNDVVLMQKLAD
jgi:2-polyprenyl-3-methyl-5-hydroxy-6-metoxy-1,4-benzoquinol methylase